MHHHLSRIECGYPLSERNLYTEYMSRQSVSYRYDSFCQSGLWTRSLLRIALGINQGAIAQPGMVYGPLRCGVSKKGLGGLHNRASTLPPYRAKLEILAGW